MKTLKSFIAIVAILLTGLTSSAQTADEIINIFRKNWWKRKTFKS